METETYVEYVYPGSFVNEEESRRVESRDPIAAKEAMPRGAFAFSFYDVEVRSGVLEDGEKIENRKVVNRSGVFYPDAATFDLAGVKALPGENSILISNMECNGYERVVRTRRGNWQVFKGGDQIV